MTQSIEVKFFEVRDRGTFMPAMAIKMTPRRNIDEDFLMQSAGFSPEEPFCIELIFIEINKCNYDPYEWKDRTCSVAHQYIQKNFDALKSGSVVDVEYILGETKRPKSKDRFSSYGEK